MLIGAQDLLPRDLQDGPQSRHVFHDPAVDRIPVVVYHHHEYVSAFSQIWRTSTTSYSGRFGLKRHGPLSTYRPLIQSR